MAGQPRRGQGLTVPQLVAAALLALGPGHPEREGHPTDWQLAELAHGWVDWSERASGWCGWRVPPEVGLVLALRESGCHNLSRHCGDGPPTDDPRVLALREANRRSSGYYCLSTPAVVVGSRALGFPCPRREAYLSDGAHRRAVCAWTVAHPGYQTAIAFQRLSTHLRATNGDLWRALSLYRFGYDGDREYPADCRHLWIRYFGRQAWPPNGRLRPWSQSAGSR